MENLKGEILKMWTINLTKPINVTEFEALFKAEYPEMEIKHISAKKLMFYVEGEIDLKLDNFIGKCISDTTITTTKELGLN